MDDQYVGCFHDNEYCPQTDGTCHILNGYMTRLENAPQDLVQCAATCRGFNFLFFGKTVTLKNAVGITLINAVWLL